ncbi:MAG: hypothetical protein MJ231_01115 [bacterium]|nr:hypothetical protein [bacterium]
MSMLLNISIIVNIVAIVFLVICYLINHKATPKVKEFIGVILASSLILYLICFSLLVIVGIVRHNWYNLLLFPFILAPFVIGHFSTSDKVFKYTAIQFFAFLMSLGILILL